MLSTVPRLISNCPSNGLEFLDTETEGTWIHEAVETDHPFEQLSGQLRGEPPSFLEPIRLPVPECAC